MNNLNIRSCFESWYDERIFRCLNLYLKYETESSNKVKTVVMALCIIVWDKTAEFLDGKNAVFSPVCSSRFICFIYQEIMTVLLCLKL